MTPRHLTLTAAEWSSLINVRDAAGGAGAGRGGSWKRPGPPTGDGVRRRKCWARRTQGSAPWVGVTDGHGRRPGACGRAGPRVEKAETHHAMAAGRPGNTKPTAAAATTVELATREAPRPPRSFCRSSVWNTPERKRPGYRRQCAISGSSHGGTWAVAREGPGVQQVVCSDGRSERHSTSAGMTRERGDVDSAGKKGRALAARH